MNCKSFKLTFPQACAVALLFRHLENGELKQDPKEFFRFDELYLGHVQRGLGILMSGKYLSVNGKAISFANLIEALTKLPVARKKGKKRAIRKRGVGVELILERYRVLGTPTKVATELCASLDYVQKTISKARKNGLLPVLTRPTPSIPKVTTTKLTEIRLKQMLELFGRLGWKPFEIARKMDVHYKTVYYLREKARTLGLMSL